MSGLGRKVKGQLGFVTLAEGSKFNLDLWHLFIVIVWLGWTYLAIIMTLASTVLKKSSFQKKSHLNALGSKFDIDVQVSQGQPRTIIRTKIGRPHISNATYQVPRSSAFWFWRRFFWKGFYHIWGWRPSWSFDQDHLNKLLFPHPKESPNEISVQLAQWFQRRCLKKLTDGRRTPVSLIY